MLLACARDTEMSPGACAFVRAAKEKKWEENAMQCRTYLLEIKGTAKDSHQTP